MPDSEDTAGTVHGRVRLNRQHKNAARTQILLVGLGLMWPYDIVRLMQGKKPGALNQRDQRELEQSKRKILD